MERTTLDRENTIANMFDRIAGRYDFLNRLLSFRQDVRWRKIMMSHVPFVPQGRFLDVATGTGDVLVRAMIDHSEYGDFLGVDISKNMLHLADHKTKFFEPKPRFEVMSAEAINLASDSIDCLTISFGLRNVVDKKVALNEFQRVLKPGASLLILEFFKPRFSIMAKCFRFYFHRILPFIGGLFSDKKAYRYLPESVDEFFSEDKLRNLLAEAGFRVDFGRRFLFGGCVLIKAEKL